MLSRRFVREYFHKRAPCDHDPQSPIASVRTRGWKTAVSIVLNQRKPRAIMILSYRQEKFAKDLVLSKDFPAPMLAMMINSTVRLDVGQFFKGSGVISMSPTMSCKS